MKTLIVASYARELKPLVALGRRHFIIKGDVGYLAAGIGPVAATFGLMHFLEDFQPAQIIALGTAGIIQPNDLAVGDLVLAKSISMNGQRVDAYVPAAINDLECSPKKDVNQYARFSRVSVFSSSEITKTERRRLELSQAGFEVENLEAYAYAFVAKKLRIPCTIILGLTNSVGPKAHQEWRQNEKWVVEKLAGVLNRFI